MMNRTQWTLAGLALAQVVLLWVVGPWTRETGTAQEGPLLPALKSLHVARITVEDGEGKTVSLTRDGQTWRIREAEGYPADTGRVERFLEDLRGIRVRRPVVSRSRYHRKLEVSDDHHERRVRLWGEGSKQPDVELLVGSSPSYGVRHVRRKGDDRVYEAKLDVYSFRPDPASWMDVKLTDVPVSRVTAVRVKNSKGHFELRKKKDRWVLTGRRGGAEVDQGAAASFVESVASLHVTEPAGKLNPAKQGFEHPAAVIEIEYRSAESAGEASGESAAAGGEAGNTKGPGTTGMERGKGEAAPEKVEIRVGREVPGGDGKRYVTRGGFDYAAILTSSTATPLLTQRGQALQTLHSDSGD